jgi:membrane fusion protein (multidrug efflux system)
VAETRTQEEQNSAQDLQDEKDERTTRRRLIIAGVVIAIALVVLGLWWHSTFTEDTDDATVDGHLIQVSARVAGQVQRVAIEENQFVHKGDVIAELDPRDYEVAVENAKAALLSAQANAEAAKVNVPITTVNTGTTLTAADANLSGSRASVLQAEQQLESARAKVAKAEAGYKRAQADLERYKPLIEKDVISKQQWDAAVAEADSEKAQLADAKAGEAAAEEQVKVARDREKQSAAQLKYAQTGPEQVAAQNARARQALAMVAQAQAQLDEAQLKLSYTKIVAPADGIVSRKGVEINQNVAAGQDLATLVELDDLWVTADFKETQLKHMKEGQEAEVKVDATGKTYHARVKQIGGATGSMLSLFPAENATGNYVKVVQRVPVRLDFTDLKNEDAEHKLRPGLSVEPTVSVK